MSEAYYRPELDHPDPERALKEWRFPAGTVENCTHCGVCLAACPTDALELDDRNVPYLARPGACSLSRLCEKVCPGQEVDFLQLQQFIMAGDKGGEAFYDPYLGPVQRTLLAHDAQPGASLRSSSGGAITALMRYALQSGLVNAVCSTAPDPTDPTRFVGKLVTDPTDLEAGRQAKYQVVPIGPLLREIDPFDRIAFVGQGCQVAGVRKLQYFIPKFREKIAYVIGFFCSTGNLEYAATEFMLRRGCDFDPKDVTNVEFRHGLYPGAFHAEHRTRGGKTVPKDAYKWLYVLYTQPRCMACVDLTAELADVSFGDAYRACTRPEGQSASVVRTSRGMELCLAAAEAGEIILEDVEAARIVKAQRLQFHVTRYLIPRRNRRRGHINLRLTQEAPDLPLELLARIKVSSVFWIFRLRHTLRWVFECLPFGVFEWTSRHTKRS